MKSYQKNILYVVGVTLASLAIPVVVSSVIIHISFQAAILIILCPVATFLLGRILAKKEWLPDAFALRYLPVFLWFFFYFGVRIILALLGDNSGWLQKAFDYVFLRDWVEWITTLFYFFVPLGFVVGVRNGGAKPAQKPRWILPTTLAAVMVFSIGLDVFAQLRTAAALAARREEEEFIAREEELAARESALTAEVDLSLYQPFSVGNQIVELGFEPSLILTERYPRLDGATAFYPTYAAVVQALYRGEGMNADAVGDYVTCSKTSLAYQNLADGKTDMIFCFEPSAEQIAYAEEQGAEYILTPIGREAFVFFVNANNPVTSLTVQQIQDIYQKKIRDWGRIGGGYYSIILPYQRNPGSGSQTIMENLVMQGKPMAEPVMDEVVVGMGEIIERLAVYENKGGAIGYSFRFYATQMNPNPEIKLLAVDDVLPTAENIQSESYPFVATIYAVTTAQGLENPNTQRLLDWLITEEGQRAVELSGYVALQ